MNVEFIENPLDHRRVLNALATAPEITVDTEFTRCERGRGSGGGAEELELIQLTAGSDVFVVDCRAAAPLGGLASLFDAPGASAWFHDPQCDLRLLREAGLHVTRKVYCTQQGACYLGAAHRQSLETLVHRFLGERIDKRQVIGDFSRRPLPDDLRDYAARDVMTIHRLRMHIDRELKKRNRWTWWGEDRDHHAASAESRGAGAAARNAWRGVADFWKLDGLGLAVLRELAEWRAVESEKRGVKPTKVLCDGTLVRLAQRRPTDLRDADRYPDPKNLRLHGPIVLETLRRGEATPQTEWPSAEPRLRKRPPLGAIDLCYAFVRCAATELEVAPELLLTRPSIERLLLAEPAAREHFRAFRGWRGEVFGPHLRDFLDGKYVACWQPEGRLVFTHADSGRRFVAGTTESLDTSGAGDATDAGE